MVTSLRVGNDKPPPSARTDPLVKSRFYAFPPSYTLQPNAMTRTSQLQSWSGLVQRYCAWKRQFRLTVADAVDSPLFHNAAIGRRLNHAEAMAVLEFMVSGKTALPAGSATVAVGNAAGNAGNSAGAAAEGATGGDAASIATVSMTSTGGGGTGDGVTVAGIAEMMGAGGSGKDKIKGFEQRAEWASPDKTAIWIYWRRPEEWAELLAEWIESTGQRGVVLTLYELTQGEATTDQDFYDMPDELLKKVLAVLTKRGKAQLFGTTGSQGVKFF